MHTNACKYVYNHADLFYYDEIQLCCQIQHQNFGTDTKTILVLTQEFKEYTVNTFFHNIEFKQMNQTFQKANFPNEISSRTRH